MELIEKYFPSIDNSRKEMFRELFRLYSDWNDRINVVSRKDIDQLYLRHVLHSLAIAKVCTFNDGARVLDVGTGGGFPGIPLAIMFPHTQFTLVDSIGKKITVVKSVAESLGLQNVSALNCRAETIPGKFDYVVSRAVTEMSQFVGWIWNKIDKGAAGTLPNGILYLKGGDLTDELAAAAKQYVIYDIPDYFLEDFFDTKKIVYIPR